jgi:glutaconyl-CoA/methylmalonyl-CoA decarboxylase subunit gamma
MKKLRITVGKKTYDVTVEVLSDDDPQRGRMPAAHLSSHSAPSPPPPSSPSTPESKAPMAAGAVTSPMAGTVKSLLVKAGDTVEAGQALVILDAMKMEVPVSAPVAGTVESVAAREGQAIQEGAVLVVLR